MYQPPIDDYEFLLRNVIKGNHALDAATNGEYKIDDARVIWSGAADLAMQSWHPLNIIGDRIGNKFVDGTVITPAGTAEAYRSVVDAGWLAAVSPKSAGGDGMPWLLANPLNEIWSAANMALSLTIGLSAGAIVAVDSVADATLRDVYLPELVSGRANGTMNLTEPQAGTDLGAIRTIARPNDDSSWAINGQKILITWGDHDLTDNIFHLVLARTPDAPAGIAGLSLFLVPKSLLAADRSPAQRNSVHTVTVEHKLGIHASATCALDFDDATGFLVGAVNGGLIGMFKMMNVARVGTGVQGLGVSDRAYQQARDYAGERIQGRVLDRPGGTPIAEHPDVARLLLSMASVISAMRGLSMQVAEWLDRARSDPRSGSLAEFFVPVLKGWFTETAVLVTSDAIQVHGGMGYIEETGAAQHLRDARILPIYEGTTAIQAKDLVGRKVLRDNAGTARVALDAIDVTLDELEASSHHVARRCAQRLRRAVASAQAATASLIDFGTDDKRRDAYAGSVAYLQLWGLLAGGWLHARMVLAALAHPDKHTERRLREADFYTAHHLSRIAWLAETVSVGEIA